MRKIVSIIAVTFIATLILVGCGQKKAKDIDVASIKTACDCVDANLIVISEMYDLMKEMVKLAENAKKTGGAMLFDNQNVLKLLEQSQELEMIGDNINRVCSEFDDEEIMKCKNFEKLQNLVDKVEDLASQAYF